MTLKRSRTSPVLHSLRHAASFHCEGGRLQVESTKDETHVGRDIYIYNIINKWIMHLSTCKTINLHLHTSTVYNCTLVYTFICTKNEVAVGIWGLFPRIMLSRTTSAAMDAMGNADSFTCEALHVKAAAFKRSNSLDALVQWSKQLFENVKNGYQK